MAQRAAREASREDDLSLRRWLKLTALAAVVLAALQLSPLGEFLDGAVARKANFAAREAIGASPALSTKLKIIAFDDHSLAAIGRRDLGLAEWARLLRALAARSPRAVLVDKVFQVIPREETGLQALLATLSSARVAVGSFPFGEKLAGRSDLVLDRARFALPAATELGTYPIEAPNVRMYGPQPPLAEAFWNVGHIIHLGQGVTQPLLRFADGKGVFHLGLYVARTREVRDGRVVVDGTAIPVAVDGRMPVNLVARSDFFPRTSRLAHVLDLVDRGEALSFVDVDDVVIVLPEMYTGGTDYRDTPVGRVAGGYVLASVANSALTGEWLTPVGAAAGAALVLFAVALGAVLAWRIRSRMFWAAIGLATIGVGAAGIALFCAAGYLVPWLVPALAVPATGGLVFVERARRELKRAQRLRYSLEDLVSPDKLEEIIRHRAKLRTEASEQILTVMFMDVVGFSVVAETLSPGKVFEHLSRTMAFLAEVIHTHGGVIDRTIGDGLFCYFGYSHLAGEAPNLSHAEAALRCALEIQRGSAQRVLTARATGQPVFPLRIGINTGLVCIGDLGGGGRRRVDYTVIGHGVNFANRPEAACDMFEIMLGPATFDQLPAALRQSPAVKKRLFGVKHRDQLEEAYEFSPWQSDPGTLRDAIAAYRDSVGIQRKDYRWPVPPGVEIAVTTPMGVGQVVNFSLDGIAFTLRSYIAKGVDLQLELAVGGPGFKPWARERGLLKLSSEVRWGREHRGEFLHGVLFKALSTEQREALVGALREACKAAA